MVSPRLASRYAKSIYLLAKEKGELDKVIEDMHWIDDTIKSSKDLKIVLTSPVINSDKKETIVQKIFKGKVSDLTFSFVHLLAKKGREMFLPEIAPSFIEKYNRENHIVAAKLVTAVAVDYSTIEKVKETLLSIDGNEGVEITTEVDPEVIGGFVLHYGDKLLDASIQRKLQLIKKEILDSSYISKI